MSPYEWHWTEQRWGALAMRLIDKRLMWAVMSMLAVQAGLVEAS